MPGAEGSKSLPTFFPFQTLQGPTHIPMPGQSTPPPCPLLSKHMLAGCNYFLFGTARELMGQELPAGRCSQAGTTQLLLSAWVAVKMAALSMQEPEKAPVSSVPAPGEAVCAGGEVEGPGS